MKIRYMVILYTAVLLGIAVFTFQKIDSLTFENRDMVEINEAYHVITEQLENEQSALEMETMQDGTVEMVAWDETRKEIEEEMNCRIIRKSEADYQSRLNEAIIENEVILDYEVEGQLFAKICLRNQGENYEAKKRELWNVAVVLLGLVWFVGIFLFSYLYMRYIRPFQELRRFAREVARGNLDMPLAMTKGNYFGAFTESFDIMREELKRARENEYRANISKKELVAELSHDVKTPVATIKAACEILQVKEKEPAILEKVALIDAKANMIDRLISNLFQATLEELEVLKVESTEEASTCIEEMFYGLRGYGNLIIENKIPECLVIMDVLRMNQVVDNLVNNAYKYAKTPIHVSFLEEEEGIRVRIRDEGAGVPEEELSKLTEKFYRGSNAAKETGSGLGLYLAKNFMEKMQGQVDLYNDHGFVVELYLRKV